MKRLMSLGGRLKQQEHAVASVEFAMLAPVLIAMMFGVLQIGLAAQNYSAVRNVSADVARYTMIQYTTGHPMPDDVVIARTKAIAEAGPYYLSAPPRLQASVADVTTPQVPGTIEKTLTITYQIPTLLDHLGVRGPTISYSRPLIATES